MGVKAAETTESQVQPQETPAGYTNGLTVGRIVHYVLDVGLHKGEHRPAIVVKVWDKAAGTCQLQVFTDEMNDGISAGTLWRTSVTPDPSGEQAYSWHWIERAD